MEIFDLFKGSDKYIEKEYHFPKFEETSDHWAEYFYPDRYDNHIGQGILRNFHGLKQAKLLFEAENFSAIRNTIDALKVQGNFDLQHLRSIHKTLFGRVYAWGGEPRHVHMLGKGGQDCFVHPDNFQSVSDDIFNKLKERNYLGKYKDSKALFAHYFVETYLDINRLHYFREGNGRAQNIFMAKVAEKNGYYLDFASIAKEEKLQRKFYALFDGVDKGETHSLVSFFEGRLKVL